MFHPRTPSRGGLPDFSLDRAYQAQQTWLRSRMFRKLDVDLRQIRLVSIMPGRWCEDASCKLTVVCLDDKPIYEALSYTWGDPTGDTPISVQGVEVLVTKTLCMALRRLRHVDVERRIWVDALCINQSDSKFNKCVILYLPVYFRTHDQCCVSPVMPACCLSVTSCRTSNILTCR